MLIKATSIYLAGILDIILGYFIYRQNPKDKKNISFFLFTLSIGIWSIAVANFVLSISEFWNYFWMQFIVISLLAIPATFYHLVIAFSSDNFKKNSGFILYFYLLISLSIIYALFPKFVITKIISHPTEKIITHGLGYQLFSTIYGIIMIYSFVVFYNNIKKAKFNTRPKKINQYLFYGFASAFLIGSVFNWLILLFGNHKFIWVGPNAIFIFIGIIAYTMLKHHLFNIQIMISRSLAFGLIFAIYSIIGTFSIYLYSLIFPLAFNLITITFFILMLFITGLTFHPLRLHLQTTPDKFLFKKKYIYDQAIKELAEISTRKLKLDEVIKIFSSKAKEVFKTKKADIYLLQTDESYQK